MLTRLYISNIVLIEKLNLEFGAGLSVLTGETGAGKSILLDSLALALGARSDAGLVRSGCDMASVIAEFDEINESLKNTLSENGIEYEDNLILRRTLSNDGKSRAWINDVPVSIKLLKQVGDELVEIHGQFANHALLDPQTHKSALDTFACSRDKNYLNLLTVTKQTYNEYHDAESRLKELKEMLEKSAMERDFLQHNVTELNALNVKVGEEEELANRRAIMMNAEKDAAILSDATAALNPRGDSLDSQIFSVAHILQRIKTEPNPYQEQIDELYDIAQRISEISQSLNPVDIDVENLDSIEERLFAIRAAARKHRVGADELPQKLAQMTAQLNQLDNSDAELKKLTSELITKKAAFDKAAKDLSVARKVAAENLRKCILTELPDLKLGQADFMVQQSESAPNQSGVDDILFVIKTNPGMPFAPLNKAASGGELARLMLAMRVVLGDNKNAHTFIFDEVDTGISGATASAVGQRLNRLAQNGQAIVITHSAQVAGFADAHFKISKSVIDGKTITDVKELPNEERLQELARIISGAEITPQALETAKTLLK